MSTYIYKYVYIYIYICLHIYVYICLHIYVYIYICICRHTCIFCTIYILSHVFCALGSTDNLRSRTFATFTICCVQGGSGSRFRCAEGLAQSFAGCSFGRPRKCSNFRGAAKMTTSTMLRSSSLVVKFPVMYCTSRFYLPVGMNNLGILSEICQHTRYDTFCTVSM